MVRAIGRGPRRRRIVVVGAAAVTVLVGGLAVADRMVASRAAGRLAARLACVAGTPSPPRVRITGFPFARQAMAGRLDRVEVDAGRVSRGAVTVDRVSAVLSGARLPDGGARGPVRVDAVEIAFVVPFDGLPAQLRGRPVRYRAGGDGLLAVSAQLATALGEVPVTLLARPALSGGRLTVVPVEVDVLGVRRPAARFADRLGGTAALSRDLPHLPAGLAYRSVTTTATGLRLTVGGRSLSVGAHGDGTHGDGSARAGDGSARAGDGSARAGDGSARAGDGVRGACRGPSSGRSPAPPSGPATAPRPAPASTGVLR